MGCPMQGIIHTILQYMKSVYSLDGALVISARVFYGGKTFVISSRPNVIRACLVSGDGEVPSIFQDDPMYLESCTRKIYGISVWI